MPFIKSVWMLAVANRQNTQVPIVVLSYYEIPEFDDFPVINMNWRQGKNLLRVAWRTFAYRSAMGKSRAW